MTKRKSKYINFRITPERRKKLFRIAKWRRQTMTDVVSNYIDRAHAQVPKDFRE